MKKRDYLVMAMTAAIVLILVWIAPLALEWGARGIDWTLAQAGYTRLADDPPRIVVGVMPTNTASVDVPDAAPQGATGEITAPEAGPEVADGPVEETELGRSVWNGATFPWENIPAEIADNQFLVAHGDLRAKGESAIAVFKTAKAARTFLRHGTWAMVLVTVPEGEALDEYLEALNERLGSGYSLVLEP